MSFAEKGFYRELMDECWLKGSVPSCAVGIAELLDVEVEEVSELLPGVIKCFDVKTDGTMTSPFIEEVRTEIDQYRLMQANRRKDKDKHGNPSTTEHNQSEPRITADNRGAGEEKRREEKRVHTSCVTPPASPPGLGLDVDDPVIQNPSPTPVLPQSSPTTLPGARKPRTPKAPKPEEQTLEQILDGKGSQTWERFWKMVGVWNRDKTPAPKTLAAAWIKACAKADPKDIYISALHYRDEFLPPKRKTDETQFMRSPLVWLEEEGWNTELQAIGAKT